MKYLSVDEEAGGTGDGRDGTGGRGCTLVLVGGINSGWHCVKSGRGGAPAGRQREPVLRRTVADSSRERGPRSGTLARRGMVTHDAGSRLCSLPGRPLASSVTRGRIGYSK